MAVRTGAIIYSDEEPLVRKVEPVGSGTFIGSLCTPCCQCCGFCCGGICVLVLWVVLLTWTTQCGLTSLPVENILPANAIEAGTVPLFDMGTSENMNVDPTLDIDMTGTWWMDGTPAYFEQLVSFAGAQGVGPFPTTLFMPTNGKGRWTWSDTLLGRFIMGYYNFISTVDATHDFHFVNSSFASITPVDEVTFGAEFGFKKISIDEWNRGDVYILRRIIYEDGTPHPVQWRRFLDYYYGLQPDGMLVVYTTNNQCLRRCEFLLPCFICTSICGPA